MEFGVYIGEADDEGIFQPGDLLVAVEEEDCLEANLITIEARLSRLTATQHQDTHLCLLTKL